MNSSKNPEFSSTDQEAVSLWKIPELEGQARPNKKTESAHDQQAMPHLTVTEIEAMQKQAYDEAFAQGKADGYQQGYDAGFQEGSKNGHEESKEKLDNKAAQFASLMDGLSEPFQNLDEEVEQELVTLAIGLASQIIRRELKTDPGEVVAAVRQAIKVLPLSSQKVSLYLHPEDSELVRSVLSLDDMSPAWTIVDDPLITRGGCKIDTDVSHVDATVENRLAAAIANVFGSERVRDRNS
jgi:flagellar assembly protein FliH